ncbi:MAG: 50S ribosomal protein L11 methyltransferase [Christensenellales bacterium]|jgi:ribosomal protein L11 methyltransferase
MDWVEISVHTTSAGAEAVSEALFECGAAGTAIEDDAVLKEIVESPGNWDYVDEGLREKVNRVCNTAIVKGYLPDDDELQNRLDCLRLRLDEAAGYIFDMGSLEIYNRSVCEEDWANNWKQYYKPLRVGDSIVIKPSWEDYEPESGDIVIELDPGMAFGTGTHETTQLCLKLLEKHVKKGHLVIDIGCGTGILAIAAAKLGANSVEAIDIDAQSVSIAKENAKNNNADIKVTKGDLLSGGAGRADVITANIIADAIISLAPEIPRHLKPGGVFIASGIIKEREGDVMAALEKNRLVAIETLRQGEWVAICARATV